MKYLPNYRLFTLSAVFFIIGILCGTYLSFEPNSNIFYIVVLLIILLITINALLKNPLFSMGGIAILLFFLGLNHYALFAQKHRINYEYDTTHTLTGRVINSPAIDYKSQKFIFEISSIDNREIGDNQRLLATFPRFPRLSYGDNLQFSGKIEKPGKIDDFSYENYLKKDRIFGLTKNPDDVYINPGSKDLLEKVIYSLYSLADKFENTINHILPEPHASLANGILLGSKQSIPDDLKDSLKKTGLSHLTALSGYNVTIIVILLSNILVAMVSRKTVFVLSGLLIISFVILTGASSSVVRAAIFSLALIAGKLSGRQPDFLNLLLFPAILMLIINPFLLVYDVGFQLSFLAFTGLIYISPIITKLFKIDYLPEWISGTLIETLSAQIAVFPLLLVTFGSLSLIAPVSNVLVLWAIPYIMALTFIGGILGMIYIGFGKIVIPFLWSALEYLHQVVVRFAKIPHAALDVEVNNFLIGAVLYLVLIVFWLYYKKRLKIKL